MNILSIDTAMFACSAACYSVIDDNGHSEVLAMPRGQAEHLVPMIERVLDKQNWKYNEIDLIAVTRGPGAFTGVRIGLATAQGLALSLDVPIVGVVTTQVLAKQYFATLASQESRGALVVTETKRKDYYVQAYNQEGNAIVEPSSKEFEEISKTYELGEYLIIGDAAKRFGEQVSQVLPDQKMEICAGVFDLPDPIFVAKQGFEDYRDGLQTGHIDNLHPLYLRQADVSKPKNQPRKLSAT